MADRYRGAGYVVVQLPFDLRALRGAAEEAFGQ
jgi:hypothetical protein